MDKPKTIRITEEDEKHIEVIRSHYQLDTSSSAIRIAIRKLGRLISRREAKKQ